jgi:hypothetical protein
VWQLGLERLALMILGNYRLILPSSNNSTKI